MQLRSVLAPLAALAAWPIAGMAETMLRWTHVYEATERYHMEALVVAEKIKKRTNGKHHIDACAASQLSNEDQLNVFGSLAPCD